MCLLFLLLDLKEEICISKDSKAKEFFHCCFSPHGLEFLINLSKLLKLRYSSMDVLCSNTRKTLQN